MKRLLKILAALVGVAAVVGGVLCWMNRDCDDAAFEEDFDML